MGLRVSLSEALTLGWIKDEKSLPVSPLVRREFLPDSPKKKGRRKDREGEEQANLIVAFAEKYPEYGNRLIHIPNGGYRTKTERWIMVKTGVRRGVPDLLLPVPRGPYRGLWIEFKASPPHAAPVTDSQEDWVAFLNGQGYRALVARGFDAALNALDDYMQMEAAADPQ